MMYLRKMCIKKFRCIKEETLVFNKGLNVLIGENNSGKTAVIDALRIALGWGVYKKDIYLREDDFYKNKEEYSEEFDSIEFDLFFSVEQDTVEGIFNDLVTVNVKGETELQMHFRFNLEDSGGRKKIKHNIWGGENEGNAIEPEILDLLYHVHLDALRNVNKDLWPGRGNKLGQLFVNLEPDTEKQQELSGKAHKNFAEDEDWNSITDNAKEKINNHLSNTTIDGKGLNIDINFLPVDFVRIAEGLRIQTPIFSSLPTGKEQEFFEIFQNGLGFNNLIYIATVLGDLLQRRKIQPYEYSALLIEEPEAHLQPQLQTILFNYLNSYRPEFQIFISSHSPTITAKANIDSVIVMQKQANDVECFSVKNLGLDEKNKKFLHRFLDVTKSQLLFANGVILVEGISEALLLPIFAELMGLREGDRLKYSIDKNGIEIVNINGVAFEPFAKLFNSPEDEKRLKSRCVVVTDDDSSGEDISDRAKSAQALEGENLKVEMSQITFEHELYNTGNNSHLLKAVYEEMHSRTNIVDADDFLEKLKSNRDKAVFSQNLAFELEKKVNSEKENSLFKIPEYIENSIKWVCRKE